MPKFVYNKDVLNLNGYVRFLNFQTEQLDIIPRNIAVLRDRCNRVLYIFLCLLSAESEMTEWNVLQKGTVAKMILYTWHVFCLLIIV
jgi:hypothetical protein